MPNFATAAARAYRAAQVRDHGRLTRAVFTSGAGDTLATLAKAGWKLAHAEGEIPMRLYVSRKALSWDDAAEAAEIRVRQGGDMPEIVYRITNAAPSRLYSTRTFVFDLEPQEIYEAPGGAFTYTFPLELA